MPSPLLPAYHRPTALTHLEAHHEAAGGALAAVEEARPLEPHVDVVQIEVLPAGLALAETGGVARAGQQGECAVKCQVAWFVAPGIGAPLLRRV